MNTKEAYLKKIEAELELAQAKLITWKAKAKNLNADLNLEFNKQVGEFEGHYSQLKKFVKEIAEDWFKVTKHGIHYYEKIFSTPYPFGKLD